MAEAEIDGFAAYAHTCSDAFATAQFLQIDRVLAVMLKETPNMWGYFYLTGAPYRGNLFRAGRRTSYWFVYTVSEETKTVNVLRFWNASQDPDAFEI